MGRSNETFNKKEKEKKRQKKQQDKKEKSEQRKATSVKGKGLEDMMAYIDENGNITSKPPVTLKPKAVELADIVIATPKQVRSDDDGLSHGAIAFYNEAKGFGFIRDDKTRGNIFFHVNNLSFAAKENDRVTFDTESGPRGLTAVKILKEA